MYTPKKDNKKDKLILPLVMLIFPNLEGYFKQLLLPGIRKVWMKIQNE